MLPAMQKAHLRLVTLRDRLFVIAARRESAHRVHSHHPICLFAAAENAIQSL